MSDERVRELERRWRQSGLPEDCAAWLRERMRSGELPADRLELAAALGDAAACGVFGWPVGADPSLLLEPLGRRRCCAIVAAAGGLVSDRCAVLVGMVAPKSALELARAFLGSESAGAVQVLLEVAKRGIRDRSSLLWRELRIAHHAECSPECLVATALSEMVGTVLAHDPPDTTLATVETLRAAQAVLGAARLIERALGPG